MVYASLGGVAALCAACAGVAGAVRAARRVCAPRKPRQRPKYRLLPLADTEDKPCQYSAYDYDVFIAFYNNYCETEM